MGIPLWQSVKVGAYVMKQRLKGRKRYPLVLMLEPLFRCNLECAGCGKIQYPDHVLNRRLSPEDCFKAVEECGAPVVSIAGGEPLIHPEIAEITAGLIARKKFVYLCTNAVPLEKKLSQFKPSKYFTFSIHMDGLEETHDKLVCKKGVYQTAVKAIKAAREAGFRITTNTTVFSGEDPQEIRAMFDEMSRLGVEGMMISPGYSYEKAPDQEHFLRRQQTKQLFREILGDAKPEWQFNHSPFYLQFLVGEKDYECTPWGNPTFNVFGWQRPCYLMQDGYAETFEQLMQETEWERYGTGRDPRCADCMVHSGYEASSVVDATSGVGAGLSMVKALAFGPGIKRQPKENQKDLVEVG